MGLPARARGRCLRLPRGHFERTPGSGMAGAGLGKPPRRPVPRSDRLPSSSSCYSSWLPSFLPVRGIVKPPSPLATAELGAAAWETSVAGRGVPGAGAGVGAALLRPGPPRAAGGRRPEAGAVLVGRWVGDAECVVGVDPGSLNSAYARPRPLPPSRPPPPLAAEDRVLGPGSGRGGPGAMDRRGQSGARAPASLPAVLSRGEAQGQESPRYESFRVHERVGSGEEAPGRRGSSERSSDTPHSNATASGRRTILFYGGINGRNFAASRPPGARAATPPKL